MKNINISSRITPEFIDKLKPNQIFTYGANMSFRHGAGAAKKALEFGAKHGQGPFVGNTYGICTKDKNIESLPIWDVREFVNEFIDMVYNEQYAQNQESLHFLVTKIGMGLASFSLEDIAPLFISCIYLPNVSLPREFWDFYKKTLYTVSAT